MSNDMFNSVITFGQSAVKYMVLINGGACMAILAFIGSIYEKDENLARRLVGSLEGFGAGVLLAALVSGVTYISQGYYAMDRDKPGDIFRWFAISLGAMSYVAFAIGGIAAINAIL